MKRKLQYNVKMELFEPITDPDDLEVFNLNSITDEKLRSATRESLETGKITPLLKEELKCRILSRCLEEGKELSPERITTIQPKKGKLKPDEMVRLERRRDQNRRAARKFRLKKQDLSSQLLEESSELEVTNQKIRDDIQHLMSEKYYLQCLLSGHKCARQSPVSDLSSPVDRCSSSLSIGELSSPGYTSCSGSI